MAKGRESGMPEESQWESYFDPHRLLAFLGCNNEVLDAVEFGCGYGTFTSIAASMVSGRLFAFDIEPEMVSCTLKRCTAQNITNVVVSVRDFCADGTGLPSGSSHFVMLFNILHIEHSLELLLEAKRLLAVNGRIAVIHWRSDIQTPRGPSLEIRPKPSDCANWAKLLGLDVKLYPVLPFCEWHWAAVMTAPTEIESSRE